MDWINSILEKVLYDPTLSKIAAAVVGALLIFAAVRLLRRFVINRHVKQTTLRNQLRTATNLLGYLLVFLYIYSVFSNSLGQLTVLFGVLGAGITFALQEVITSIAGWVALSLGNFYRIGDRVQLGGIKGDVLDIGLLRTTVIELGDWVKGDQYNGRTVRIANSFVFKEPVFNYSAEFPFLWDEILIPVRHGSERALARAIILRVLNEATADYIPLAREAWQTMTNRYAIEAASVEPIISMVANDNWLAYTARYVVDYKKRRSTKDMLYNRILDEFDATEGRVAFASATFEVTSVPALRVRVEQ